MSAAFPTAAPRLRDVTLRDGLQDNRVVSTETKLAIVDGLVGAGVTSLELGSFVRADRVPAMADTPELFAQTISLADDVERWALVLNRRGVELALAAGATHLQYVISVSPPHSRANTGLTPLDALDQLASIARDLPAATEVELTLATSFGCPFAGAVAPDAVLALLDAAATLPIGSFNLADTIGTAVPADVSRLVTAVKQRAPEKSVGIHLHDTRGLGVLNAVTAAEAGIDRIDASVGGLGGCPFAPGASGNVAIEDLVHLFRESGLTTGIDLDRLVEVAHLACTAVGRAVESHVGVAGPRFASLAPEP